MRLLTRSLLVLLSSAPVALADYFEETGYRSLAAALGSALPDGTGIAVTMVEYGDPEYLPQEGEGSFPGTGGLMAGKVFTAKSGRSGASGHAFEVGSHIFGLNTDPALGRASFTPGINQADFYRVDALASPLSWNKAGWLKPGTFTEPRSEANAVQNHSWISVGSSATAVSDKDALARFDFAILRDGFLAVTGVNNGPSSVPAQMASAYNNLAVGLSSGNHSTGGVASWLDGPRRQKPEIVAPLDYTSFSTALVSSAAALLRQAANSQGTAATRPETLKAIMLAGATKEEFPGWSRTPTAPLDPVFGAGELHVANSWFILAGLGQSANLAPPGRRQHGPESTLSPSTTADYLLSVPPGMTGEALSAVVVWNRIVRDTNPESGFNLSVDALADYNLTLARVPATGSPVVLEESLGSVENVEHVYRRQLPSGTYRLRLSLASGSNVPAALAWRLSPVPHRPGITLTTGGGQDQLNFTGLVTGQSYLIQASADLISWNPVQAFTAVGTTFAWGNPTDAGGRFYRLAATD